MQEKLVRRAKGCGSTMWAGRDLKISLIKSMDNSLDSTTTTCQKHVPAKGE
jgi:hypothetical protein